MTKPLNFQSIIIGLEKFWADYGCLIWQPYNHQVGAGTMNPATFLRVLGPEPWQVAYVEPSVRPDDGRYGENPNRLQQHYQYQVILKPDPGDPQEVYLKSLEAVGINPREHDIRFVEDNWESPALGAWGLGWEVWLDGQEITQFTYFQQAGGFPCDPVSVELTYGLERIAIALQNIKGFRDIPWTDAITYGDVNLQAEQEHSKYYFEVAEVDRLRQMYALYVAEAKTALAAGLVLPAYDYVLKCSHTFNVLDARGAIGVTERQATFGQMRALARQVAEAYMEQRRRLEYPLLKPAEGLVSAGAKRAAPEKRLVGAGQGAPATLLVEIGTEELPAADLETALAQLRELTPKMLAEARLAYTGSLSVYGTPRRLAVVVENLIPRQPDSETVVKGPAATRAYDAQGAPTPAALGFAKSKGVPVESLERRTLEGGEYVVAVVRSKGRPAAEVLAEILPKLVSSIKFEKTMRWRAGDATAFSRPIRWLVALLGEAVIPFEYAGLTADRVSRGLRPLGSPDIVIPTADAYLETLRTAHIEADPAKRRALVLEQVQRCATDVGGLITDESVLDEVTNLVECPTALVGSFEPVYLALPRDVLISVMKKHQRYFPVQKADGRLLPHFIAVRNGDKLHLDLVREGNEHVIRARFADADFFVREDAKLKLEEFRPRLSTLTFQKKLGSMLDKSERVEKLTAEAAHWLKLDEAEARTALRAAHLCKADLATQMVVEMTSLQGIMGREYALRSGEAPEVALAIQEQYGVPESRPGMAVGIADRLDSLAGLFAAGLAPTGSADPFGLRRAALGLVQICTSRQIEIDLRAALAAACAVQAAEVQPAEAQLDNLMAFVAGRLRAQLLDLGYRYDVVEAVLAEQAANPYQAFVGVRQLSEWVKREDWPQILPAYARCVRITRDQQQVFPVSAERLGEPAEKGLYAAYQLAVARPVASVDEFLGRLLPMIPAISTFFDEVLVMADDPAVRENRLGLLQKIGAMAEGLADFSKLEGF